MEFTKPMPDLKNYTELTCDSIDKIRVLKGGPFNVNCADDVALMNSIKALILKLGVQDNSDGYASLEDRNSGINDFTYNFKRIKK